LEPTTGEWADQSARAGIAGALNMYYTAEYGGGIYICKIYYVPEEGFDAA
jgi:hypothetical protein